MHLRNIKRCRADIAVRKIEHLPFGCLVIKIFVFDFTSYGRGYTGVTVNVIVFAEIVLFKNFKNKFAALTAEIFVFDMNRFVFA
jgi:hypothetical protein